MRKRRALSLLAVLLLVLGLAACGDDDDGTETGSGSASGSASAPAETVELDITATDFAFEGVESTIEGGLVELTLTNEGEADHEAFFLGIGDKEPAVALEELTKVFEGGPFPRDLEAAGGVIEVEPGDSVETEMVLRPGRYALICTLDDEPGDDAEGGEEPEAQAQPHFARGMQLVVEVEGGEDAELPEAEHSITARDYTFDVDVEAGEQTVLFSNEGPKETHHAVIVGFAEGRTEEQAQQDIEAFLAADDGGPPPEGVEEPEDIGGTQVFDPGLGGTYRLTFESGRVYAVLCFISDREGGPPHAIARQMVKVFTVE